MSEQIVSRQVVECVPLSSGNGTAYGVRLGDGALSLGLFHTSDKCVVMRFGVSDEVRPTGSAVCRGEGESFQPGDLLIKVPGRESALVLLEVVARLLAEFPVIRKDDSDSSQS